MSKRGKADISFWGTNGSCESRVLLRGDSVIRPSMVIALVGPNAGCREVRGMGWDGRFSRGPLASIVIGPPPSPHVAASIVPSLTKLSIRGLPREGGVSCPDRLEGCTRPSWGLSTFGRFRMFVVGSIKLCMPQTRRSSNCPLLPPPCQQVPKAAPMVRCRPFATTGKPIMRTSAAAQSRCERQETEARKLLHRLVYVHLRNVFEC